MDRDKIQRIYRAIMLVVVTFFITAITTISIMYTNFKSDGTTQYVLVSNDETNIGNEISTLKKIIDKYYLGEIDDEKLKEAALVGYVAGLDDEYSEYITKEKYEEFNTNIMGNYVGIGIYMSVYKDTNQIVVLAPMQGSPAEKAGIKSGDIILQVDGIAYEGADGLDIAAKKIKGEIGTVVHLQLKREEEIYEVDVTRDKVIINPVTSKVIEETNIGYIEITSFDEDCSKSFKEEFEKLNKNGIKSLIIDLRNNGGGIVQEALNIADYIVPKDSTLMITVNKKENETSEKAKEDPIINMPVVVLVNENSASASEILVGALKDNGYAKIVGTKTYGKGVIQEILKLKDGSALKLTTEEYFTPNRTKINKTGIEPDEIVEMVENTDTNTKNDTQLNKAIEMLKGN